MKLSGKNAVVTGGTGGIGKAIVTALLAEDVTVCLLSRNSVDVQTYRPAGRSDEATVQAYRGDLVSDTDVAAFCEYLGGQLPTIDILVHSAGAYCAGSVEDTPVEELDRVYRVNVRAPYLLTRLLLPRLIQSKGQIVFMNSSAGVKTGAGLSQYASSKFALRALSDSLRQEVNEDEVRVLSVFPGRTASRMQEKVHRLEQRAFDPRYLIQPEDIAEMVVKSLELPRSAEVTDIHIRPLRKIP
jgi:NAD(P)-dependent dehydrogenase (short-subunit alcohol dehydrogenase family)